MVCLGLQGSGAVIIRSLFKVIFSFSCGLRLGFKMIHMSVILLILRSIYFKGWEVRRLTLGTVFGDCHWSISDHHFLQPIFSWHKSTQKSLTKIFLVYITNQKNLYIQILFKLTQTIIPFPQIHTVKQYIIYYYPRTIPYASNVLKSLTKIYKQRLIVDTR